MLVSARLVAVTVGFSSTVDLPWPGAYGERAALAVLGAAAVTVLLVLLVRDDEPRLWLASAAGEGLPGGVSLPAAALEGAAEDAAAGHPDALRIKVTARGNARRVRLELRVVARPLVDEQRMGRALERRAEDALRPVLGAGELEVRARVHGVRVGRLARYLP